MTTTPTTSIPAGVVVGPYTYAISSDKNEINQAKVEDGDDLYGRTEFANLIILLDPDCCYDIIAETLLHEILHTIFFMSGVDVKEKKEEAIIRCISPILLDVLRRNPSLMEFLCRS